MRCAERGFDSTLFTERTSLPLIGIQRELAEGRTARIVI